MNTPETATRLPSLGELSEGCPEVRALLLASRRGRRALSERGGTLHRLGVHAGMHAELSALLEVAGRPERRSPERDSPERDSPERDSPERDSPERDSPEKNIQVRAARAAAAQLRVASELPLCEISPLALIPQLADWGVLREAHLRAYGRSIGRTSPLGRALGRVSLDRAAARLAGPEQTAQALRQIKPSAPHARLHELCGEVLWCVATQNFWPLEFLVPELETLSHVRGPHGDPPRAGAPFCGIPGAWTQILAAGLHAGTRRGEAERARVWPPLRVWYRAFPAPIGKWGVRWKEPEGGSPGAVLEAVPPILPGDPAREQVTPTEDPASFWGKNKAWERREINRLTALLVYAEASWARGLREDALTASALRLGEALLVQVSTPVPYRPPFFVEHAPPINPQPQGPVLE